MLQPCQGYFILIRLILTAALQPINRSHRHGDECVTHQRSLWPFLLQEI